MDLQLPGGALIAAWPGLPDPNFAQTVLLMCDHSEQGAFGLVLNRLLELKVSDLLPDHPVLGRLSTAVYLGGPVDHQRLQFVHMLPGRIQGGREVCTGLWIGGDLDQLAEVLAESEDGVGSEPPVKLFLGYAGWSEGQLESELAEGTWMPAPFDSNVIFSGQGERTWEAVVESVDPERSGEPDSTLGDASDN
ncbi:MAG: YqgE/AlgH family protein [Planctomycetota bacterium]|jgi:putative transcriptional regulator